MNAGFDEWSYLLDANAGGVAVAGGTSATLERGGSFGTWVARFDIRPGEPVENAHIESFNGRLRERCLKQHAFVSLDDARTPIKACRTDYNSVRPHSALRQLAPDQFRQLHQPKT
ncbi:integrase core domain-containing protein, partial [Paraburkholderia tropica]